MESQDVEKLKKWLEVEYNSGGRHMDDVENGSGECIGEMEKIGAVLELWNMGTLYEMNDPREMDKKTKGDAFGAVKKWLLYQWDKKEEHIGLKPLVSKRKKGKQKQKVTDHFTGKKIFCFYNFSTHNFYFRFR